MTPSILAIDVSYLSYRSYFAYPSLTSKGRPTGALFGFIKTIWGLYTSQQVATIVMAADTPKLTWRHVKYADYKAGRKEIEPNMRAQLPLIAEFCKNLCGQNYIAIEGYEADDVIATTCKINHEDLSPLQINIFSSDKDLYQLLKYPEVNILPTGSKMPQSGLNYNNFTEFLGLPPHKWLLYKALVGDSSDNLPGLAGVGPKTAVSIINEVDFLEELIATLQAKKQIEEFEFGEFDNLLSWLGANNKNLMVKTSNLAPKYKKIMLKLAQNFNSFKQTLTLAELSNIANYEYEAAEVSWHKVENMLREYNFSSLIKEIYG